MMYERTARRIINQVAKRYGVKIIVAKMETPGAGACADIVNGVVELDTLKWSTPAHLASYLLHEVVHILCYREGRYKDFHSSKHPSDMTEKELLAYLSTAWKAERYVERRAQEMMKEVFPGYLFHFAYGRRELAKPWFDETFLGDFKKEYRRKKLRRIDKQMRSKNEAV